MTRSVRSIQEILLSPDEGEEEYSEEESEEEYSEEESEEEYSEEESEEEYSEEESEEEYFEDATPEVSSMIKEKSFEAVLSTMSNDLASKTEAYSLYISTERSPEEIGLSLSLPGFLVRHWIAKEKWADLKARFQAQEFKRAELQLQQFRSENALSTAVRQLTGATLLENQVNFTLEKMDKDLRGRDPDAPLPRDHTISLLRLSQVLKNASDVSARIVGISDRPPMSEAETAKTIIMIGGKPAQSQRYSEEKPVIEVKHEA